MIKIICVGKLKEKYLSDACQEYLKRITKYTKIEIIELKDSNILEEKDNILKHINKDYIITLDIEGNSIDSPTLAKKIDNILISNPNITFIIGGSCYWLYLYLLWKFKVKYMGEFVSSLLIGVLAILTTKLGWTSNLNDIIIGSVMPLVPGVPLTNAARDLVSGNLISGPTRALEAIITAMAIGCAIVIVLRYA